MNKKGFSKEAFKVLNTNLIRNINNTFSKKINRR